MGGAVQLAVGNYPDVGEVNCGEREVELAEFPAVGLPDDHGRQAQRLDKPLPAPQFVDGVRSAAQNVMQLLFGGEIGVVNELLDKG